MKNLLFVCLCLISWLLTAQKSTVKPQFRIGLSTSYSSLKLDGISATISNSGVKLHQPNLSLEAGIWFPLSDRAILYPFFEITRRSYETSNRIGGGSTTGFLQFEIMGEYRLFDSDFGILYIRRIGKLYIGIGGSFTYRAVNNEFNGVEITGDPVIDRFIDEALKAKKNWNLNSLVQLDYTLISKEKMQLLLRAYWKKSFLTDEGGGFGFYVELLEQNWNYFGLGLAMKRDL